MKDRRDEVSTTDDTKQKLITLRYGMPVIVRDEFTAATWDGIHGMKDLAPHVVPRFERREALLVDGWGEQFVLEKRAQDAVNIVTIRSTRPMDRWWCSWRCRGILGVEFTVSRADGQVLDGKELWND
jgi:hypothetical protein